MKKLLFTACAIILGVASINAKECTLDNPLLPHSISDANSAWEYQFSGSRYSKMSVKIYKGVLDVLKSPEVTYIQYKIPGVDTWSTVRAVSSDELKITATVFDFEVPNSTTAIRVYKGDDDATRYIDELMAYDNVIVPSETIDLGACPIGSTRSGSFSIDWTSASGEISTDNSSFSVDTPSFGNSDCGKGGNTTVTVTFNPKSVIGKQYTTVKVGESNSVTVSASSYLAPPTELKAEYTTDKAIALTWNANEYVSGFQVKNVTTGETQDVTTNSILWEGLNPETSYTFTVKSFIESTYSEESDQLKVATTFYDPTRCTATVDASETDIYGSTTWSYNIPSDQVSPFPLKAAFSYKRAGLVATSGRNLKLQYSTNGGSNWEDAATISAGDFEKNTYYRSPEYELPANTNAVQLKATGILKTACMTVKNIVVYYEPGLTASSAAIDFGTVAVGSQNSTDLNISYSNTEALSATIEGEGFSLGDVPEKAKCGVGKLTIPVKFNANAEWEGLEKSAVLTLSNGQTIEIPVKAKVDLVEVKNLRNTAVTTTTASIAWDAKANATQYEVTANGATNTVLTTEYQVVNLAPGAEYTFSVVAIVNGVKSPAANIQVTTEMLPAPTNVTTESTESSITISWDKVDGATEYKIVNITTSTEDYISSKKNTYTEYELEAGTKYLYTLYTMSNDIVQGSYYFSASTKDPVPTDAADIAESSIIAYANNGVVTIANLTEGDAYSILDLSGRQIAAGIAQSTSVNVAVPNKSGILIAIVNGKTIKIAF